MPPYEISPAGATDIGNVRTTNEDTFLAAGDLFAVADGMGGRGHGDAASRLAVETLQGAFAADATAVGLVEAVNQANTAIHDRAKTDPDLEGMGTTIAAVARVTSDDGSDDRLVVVNVGDSRVYLLHGENLTCLSADHSRVADLVRSGEITAEAARSHPERHILTQALGVGSQVVPHVANTTPEGGDRLLLCSDGLFNELELSEIAGVLRSVEQAGDAANQLIALANERGGNDNITALVLDII